MIYHRFFSKGIHKIITVPIVWVLGGPGSGKGTQCDKIVAKYKFTHLSTGNLLRNEVTSGTPKGKELQQIMTKGKLVPNEEVLLLLKNAINSNLTGSKGFLIDGYPREKSQGKMFEEIIAPVDMIIFYEVKEDILVKRLLGRAKIEGRSDDNAETIKLRIKTFNENNNQVLQQYTDKLIRIDASGSKEEIFEAVKKHLDQLVLKRKA